MKCALPDCTIKAPWAETETLTNVLQEQIALHLSFQGHLWGLGDSNVGLFERLALN